MDKYDGNSTKHHQMKKIKSIIIVGGGTAGWLAAGFYSSQLRDISITVIESDSVPIVGVGESVVPQFRTHLAKMGLDEDTWLRESGSTFKYGVTFENWRTGSDLRWHGFGDFLTEKAINRSWQEYGKRPSMNPVDTVLCADYWIEMLKSGMITEQEIPWYAGDTYHLVRNNRAHRTLDGHQYTSRVPGYAYNINAFRIGQTIKNHVALPRGVQHLRRHIARVEYDDAGAITELVDSLGDHHRADLYVDCTGFRRLLIGPVAQSKWISFDQRLTCKNAVGGRVNYEDDQEIFCAPHTHTVAMSSGWVWRIPLRDDIGSGYVYDSRFINEEQAVEEISQYWRSLGKHWDHKVSLKFDQGVMDRSAHQNIIACGLSSNFLEPLEATSISFTTLINELVVAVLNKHDNHWDASKAEVVSRLMKREVKYTGDFLWAHYALTQRTDSEFWRMQGQNRQEAKDMCHSWFRWHMSDIYRREKDFDHTRYNKYDWAQMITTQRIYEDCPTRPIDPALLPRARLLYQFQDQMSQSLLDIVPTHWQLIQHINR